MSYEGRDSAKVVEGYIPVTGGNIWYKIVGANQEKYTASGIARWPWGTS